jgi:hypothetical protein
MPRGGRIAGCRNLISRQRLAAVEEFLSPRRPVSSRYCLYQLASRGLYPDTTHRSYRSCKELMLSARISGELDDGCFVDNRRVVWTGETDGWPNLAEYMEPPDPRWYKRNRWQDQPVHIEVWTEKDTIAPLIKDVARNKWDISGLISTGTFSRPSLVAAAKRIHEAWEQGKRIKIFYIGDFDPTGLGIEQWGQKGNGEANQRRTEGLFEILHRKYGWTESDFRTRISWERIAATELDLKTMPAKYKLPIKEAERDEATGQLIKGDPRAEVYKGKYGDQCIEVEALEVLKIGEIADRLDRAIQKTIDADAWKKSERKEAREKKTGISIP